MLLARSDFPLVEPGSTLESRIHLAILKLVVQPPDSLYATPSPFQRFEAALQLSKTDWRDLLVSAGLAGEDWREELSRAGLEVPPE